MARLFFAESGCPCCDSTRRDLANLERQHDRLVERCNGLLRVNAGLEVALTNAQDRLAELAPPKPLDPPIAHEGQES
jgi:hypothetical protein